MIAHVGGVPVEELVPMAAGAGTALNLARTWAWAWLHIRPRRSPRTRSPSPARDGHSRGPLQTLRVR